MGNKLEGKIAVITGGGNGIGLATTKRFVLQGAYVFIIDYNKKALDSAISEIGKNVVGIDGDISNLADLEKLYSVVKDQKGHLDILFANAGIAKFASLGEISEEHFYNLFDINVKGLLFTVQKALPLFQDSGSIILNSSSGVNAVSPGSIDTPIFNPVMSKEEYEQFKNKFVKAIPMGRMGNPDEVAKAVSFLESDDSSYITGIELFVDGVAQI
jgi:NAD(P)-dependent dehydrogenase (short-subunit alcohol dehydrogenase family)